MRLQDLFDKWNLTGLKVKTPVMESAGTPQIARRSGKLYKAALRPC